MTNIDIVKNVLSTCTKEVIYPPPPKCKYADANMTSSYFVIYHIVFYSHITNAIILNTLVPLFEWN